MQRKPASSQNVVSIESARKGPDDPGPGGASAVKRKGKTFNQHVAKQAVAQFFGLGKNVYQVHRETGYPIAALQEEIRRVGYPNWEKRARGVAA